MSGLGTGISAFVNGFVGGRDVRNRWEDRKIDQARQERIDQIRDAQEGRAQESHEMGLETYGLQNTQRRQAIRGADQDWDDGQRLRAASDLDFAEGFGVARPEPTAEPLVPTGTSTKSPDVPLPDFAAAATGPVLGIARRAQDAPVATRAAAPAAPAAAPISPTPAPSMGVAPVAPPQIVGDTIVPPAYNDGSVAPAPTNSDYQWGEAGGLVRDIDRAGTAAGRAIGDAVSRTGEAVVNSGSEFIGRVNAPFQAASVYATGEDHIGAPGRVDLNRDGIEQSVVSPVFDSIPRSDESADGAGAALASEYDRIDRNRQPAPKTDSPTEAEVAKAATAVMDVVGNDPAMAAAANALPASALGATRNGAPMSATQRDRGAKRLVDSYRDVGAPNVMRELMRQGRYTEAQALDGFLRDQRSQAGLESWGRGMFAAMSGDIDAATDHLMDAYNSAGYFDDGYQVVKEDSELIKDDAGEVVGIKLTMQHQATGETFTQTGNITDFMNRALWITSPQKALETHMARQQAIQESLLKADEERRAAATDLIKQDHQQNRVDAREIFKADQEGAAASALTGEARDPISMAEARRRAMGYEDADEGEVPVLRRAQ